MKHLSIGLVMLALAGCAQNKIIVESPKCPPLPELPANPTSAEVSAHMMVLIKLYGACAEKASSK